MSAARSLLVVIGGPVRPTARHDTTPATLSVRCRRRQTDVGFSISTSCGKRSVDRVNDALALGGKYSAQTELKAGISEWGDGVTCEVLGGTHKLTQYESPAA